MKRKKEVTITPDESGNNIADWLSQRFTYYTKDQWVNIIESEKILVNTNVASKDYILEKGDTVEYKAESPVEPEINRDYTILYEDKDIIAINKPADLPCHPGGIYFKNTLWYLLKEKYDYFSLVNRLDRETSGVMIISKNKDTAAHYYNQFKDHLVKKEYLVLVHGDFPKEKNALGWLEDDADSIVRKKESLYTTIMQLHIRRLFPQGMIGNIAKPCLQILKQ